MEDCVDRHLFDGQDLPRLLMHGLVHAAIGTVQERKKIFENIRINSGVWGSMAYGGLCRQALVWWPRPAQTPYAWTCTRCHRNCARKEKDIWKYQNKLRCLGLYGLWRTVSTDRHLFDGQDLPRLLMHGLLHAARMNCVGNRLLCSPLGSEKGLT